jgi:putative methyltransferase (TIGR04325 family)
VCAAGRALLPEVRFITDDNEALSRKYDIVIAASSLQYARKFYEALDKLCTCAEGWFLLLRTPLVAEHHDFVVVQRPYGHGYRTQYPGWFVNRSKFIDRVESNGFSLEREFPAGFRVFVPNVPEQCTVSGFLFRRTI